MLYSEMKKTFEIFNQKLGKTYGEMGKEDFNGFIKFLLNDEEIRNTGWEFGQELPFDLEELLDEYLQKDEIYKPYH
jgi:hypothetical protein